MKWLEYSYVYTKCAHELNHITCIFYTSGICSSLQCYRKLVWLVGANIRSLQKCMGNAGVKYGKSFVQRFQNLGTIHILSLQNFESSSLHQQKDYWKKETILEAGFQLGLFIKICYNKKAVTKRMSKFYFPLC